MRILFLSDMPLIKYGVKSGFDQLGYETDFMYEEFRMWDKNADKQVELLKKKIEEFHPTVIFTEGFANINIFGIYDLCKKYIDCMVKL